LTLTTPLYGHCPFYEEMKDLIEMGVESTCRRQGETDICEECPLNQT